MISEKVILGIDTSNYTTSVAIISLDGKLIANLKRPLQVKAGERGLRQSDALFMHTVNLPFLMSDTVGFIRKLPTELIESFKSTLDEVREADLLIHVVDISHRDYEEQINEVNKTLQEIEAIDKPTILVFNKIDAFTYTPKEEDDLTPIKRENISLEELQRTWMSKLHDDCIFISARQKTNIDELKSLFYDRIKAIHIQRYPYNDFLFQQYE